MVVSLDAGYDALSEFQRRIPEKELIERSSSDLSRDIFQVVGI